MGGILFDFQGLKIRATSLSQDTEGGQKWAPSLTLLNKYFN
jgi:hypothetical protein